MAVGKCTITHLSQRLTASEGRGAIYPFRTRTDCEIEMFAIDSYRILPEVEVEFEMVCGVLLHRELPPPGAMCSSTASQVHFALFMRVQSRDIYGLAPICAILLINLVDYRGGQNGR